MIEDNKKVRFHVWLLIVAVFLFVLSAAGSKLITSSTFSGFVFNHVENVLHRKEQFLEKWIQTIFSEGITDEQLLHAETGKHLRKKLAGKEMSIFIYRQDSLIFWSDNTIPLKKPLLHKSSPSIIFAGNGWFIPKIKTSKDITVIGLILVKHHYPVTNKFLKQKFFKRSWLGSYFDLFSVPGENMHTIYDRNGNYWFSLRVRNPEEQPLFWKWMIFALFCMSFLITFFSLIRFIRQNHFLHPLVLSVFPIVVVILFALIIPGGFFPDNFFTLPLFSPFFFALAAWCPSVGDLFFSSLLFFSLFYSFRIIWEHRLVKPKMWILYAGFITSSLMLSGVAEVLYRLVINSSLVFEPFRILDVTVYSILGLFSVGFLFMSFLLLTDVLLLYTKEIPGRKRLWIIIVSSFVFPLLLIPVNAHVPWFTVFLFWFSTGILFWMRSRSVSMSLFLMAFVIGLFSTVLILRYSAVRREQNARLLAVNLAAEHDPVAELLMEEEINSPLKGDQELRGLMKRTVFSQTDADQIYQYLKLRYFNGYWDRYELRVIVCNPESDILVDEEPRPCFSFFRTLLDETGTPINGTRFYYLDTQNGLISYLAALYYPANSPGDSNGLYIQLDSKILYEQLGYPELLLDNKSKQESIPDVFVYAKYYNGKLVAQKGNVPFPISDEVFPSGEQEYGVHQFDGYRHIIYRPNPETTLVMSYEVLHFSDYLISFAYLFVFFFLFLIVSLFRTVFSIGLDFQNLLLKQKIQLWIISLLLFVFVLVGAGTIFFNKKQFYENHLSNLKEKLQSVYVELEHKLSFESQLDENWSSSQYASLNDLLVKFSNVFYSDINLYTGEGVLLATSRPEIFEKKLLSRRMNEEAYYQFTRRKVSEYVQSEAIGKLTFLSAYTPFFNQNNKLLAYLNLPYFTKQDLLTREISNMIVGILNSWMVLILISFALAVFISDKITNPLRKIQEKIGKFKLGQEYEHIVYSGNDEIGGLVKEYNRMIDELAKNIALLAKSERESAWREMARQIAHEIKNPLTPMKLSIQQLKRSWKDQREDFSEHLEQVTTTLVEQIDRLSKIATAFSNFARLPKTHYMPVKIIDLLGEVVNLFGGEHDIQFSYSESDKEKFIVHADKEELNSVFMNVLKNAVQSIPDGRKGKIFITVHSDDSNKNVIVSVIDNGVGIPDGLGERLFEPNFTTKSSGMGLGLAIVKKIIEDIRGEIWYKPNEGEGTTFFIRIPLYFSVDQASGGQG